MNRIAFDNYRGGYTVFLGEMHIVDGVPHLHPTHRAFNVPKSKINRITEKDAKPYQPFDTVEELAIYKNGTFMYSFKGFTFHTGGHDLEEVSVQKARAKIAYDYACLLCEYTNISNAFIRSGASSDGRVTKSKGISKYVIEYTGVMVKRLLGKRSYTAPELDAKMDRLTDTIDGIDLGVVITVEMEPKYDKILFKRPDGYYDIYYGTKHGDNGIIPTHRSLKIKRHYVNEALNKLYKIRAWDINKEQTIKLYTNGDMAIISDNQREYIIDIPYLKDLSATQVCKEIKNYTAVKVN